jgi:hypothetical protein
MRKLWVVSNERNKKAIKDNDNRLTQIQADVKANMAWLEKFEQTTKSAQLKQNTLLNGLSLQSSVLQGESESLGGRVLLLANEVTIMREERSESLERKRKELALFSRQLTDSKKEISSINASRLQLNERVIGMERRINALQLSIKTNAKGSDVQ